MQDAEYVVGTEYVHHARYDVCRNALQVTEIRLHTQTRNTSCIRHTLGLPECIAKLRVTVTGRSAGVAWWYYGFGFWVSRGAVGCFAQGGVESSTLLNIENTAVHGEDYDDDLAYFNVKVTDPKTGEVYEVQAPEVLSLIHI